MVVFPGFAAGAVVRLVRRAYLEAPRQLSVTSGGYFD